MTIENLVDNLDKIPSLISEIQSNESQKQLNHPQSNKDGNAIVNQADKVLNQLKGLEKANTNESSNSIKQLATGAKIVKLKLTNLLGHGKISMKELFRNYDIDRSGNISYDDFNKTLLLSSTGLSQDEISKITETLDEHSTGRVSYNNLIHGLDKIEKLDSLYSLASSSSSQPSSPLPSDKNYSDSHKSYNRSHSLNGSYPSDDNQNHTSSSSSSSHAQLPQSVYASSAVGELNIASLQPILQSQGNSARNYTLADYVTQNDSNDNNSNNKSNSSNISARDKKLTLQLNNSEAYKSNDQGEHHTVSYNNNDGKRYSSNDSNHVVDDNNGNINTQQGHGNTDNNYSTRIFDNFQDIRHSNDYDMFTNIKRRHSFTYSGSPDTGLPKRIFDNFHDTRRHSNDYDVFHNNRRKRFNDKTNRPNRDTITITDGSCEDDNNMKNDDNHYFNSPRHQSRRYQSSPTHKNHTGKKFCFSSPSKVAPFFVDTEDSLEVLRTQMLGKVSGKKTNFYKHSTINELLNLNDENISHSYSLDKGTNNATNNNKNTYFKTGEINKFINDTSNIKNDTTIAVLPSAIWHEAIQNHPRFKYRRNSIQSPYYNEDSVAVSSDHNNSTSSNRPKTSSSSSSSTAAFGRSRSYKNIASMTHRHVSNEYEDEDRDLGRSKNNRQKRAMSAPAISRRMNTSNNNNDHDDDSSSSKQDKKSIEFLEKTEKALISQIPGSLNGLRHHLKKSDQSSSGCVNLREFQNSLTKAGIQLSAAQTETLFSSISNKQQSIRKNQSVQNDFNGFGSNGLDSNNMTGNGLDVQRSLDCHSKLNQSMNIEHFLSSITTKNNTNSNNNNITNSSSNGNALLNKANKLIESEETRVLQKVLRATSQQHDPLKVFYDLENNHQLYNNNNNNDNTHSMDKNKNLHYADMNTLTEGLAYIGVMLDDHEVKLLENSMNKLNVSTINHTNVATDRNTNSTTNHDNNNNNNNNDHHQVRYHLGEIHDAFKQYVETNISSADSSHNNNNSNNNDPFYSQSFISTHKQPFPVYALQQPSSSSLQQPRSKSASHTRYGNSPKMTTMSTYLHYDHSEYALAKESKAYTEDQLQWSKLKRNFHNQSSAIINSFTQNKNSNNDNDGVVININQLHDHLHQAGVHIGSDDLSRLQRQLLATTTTTAATGSSSNTHENNKESTVSLQDFCDTTGIPLIATTATGDKHNNNNSRSHLLWEQNLDGGVFAPTRIRSNSVGGGSSGSNTYTTPYTFESNLNSSNNHHHNHNINTNTTAAIATAAAGGANRVMNHKITNPSYATTMFSQPLEKTNCISGHVLRRSSEYQPAGATADGSSNEYQPAHTFWKFDHNQESKEASLYPQYSYRNINRGCSSKDDNLRHMHTSLSTGGLLLNNKSYDGDYGHNGKGSTVNMNMNMNNNYSNNNSRHNFTTFSRANSPVANRSSSSSSSSSNNKNYFFSNGTDSEGDASDSTDIPNFNNSTTNGNNNTVVRVPVYKNNNMNNNGQKKDYHFDITDDSTNHHQSDSAQTSSSSSSSSSTINNDNKSNKSMSNDSSNNNSPNKSNARSNSRNHRHSNSDNMNSILQFPNKKTDPKDAIGNNSIDRSSSNNDSYNSNTTNTTPNKHQYPHQQHVPISPIHRILSGSHNGGKELSSPVYLRTRMAVVQPMARTPYATDFD